MSLLQALLNDKVCAIIRGIPEHAADATAKALVDGGIHFVEVTMNTDGALQSIHRWRGEYQAPVYIGAGTVLDVDMAKEAIEAGAQFIISPNLDEAVIAYSRERGVDVWPGCTTPTEIVRAWKAGAEAVKVFPMGSLGIGYLKEIRAPLNHIPMMATGGVNEQNLRTILEAGASAVGVGGNLVDKKVIAEGNFEELAARARRYVALASGETP